MKSDGSEIGRFSIDLVGTQDVVARALNSFFDQLNTSLLNYLLALAALGVLTMSLIQALKALLPVRYVYQSVCLRHWLKRHAKVAYERFGMRSEHYESLARGGEILRRRRLETVIRPSFRTGRANQQDGDIRGLSQKAEDDVILLAADGNAVALYDSDGEEFCKNLGAVGQLVIDFPRRYHNLLFILASNANKEDIDLLTANTPARLEDSYATAQLQPANGEEQQPGLSNDVQSLKHRGFDDPQRVLNAKNRVRQHVTQALNAFQLRSAWGWGLMMRLFSFAISFGLAMAALVIKENSWRGIGLGTLLTALLAAFLAPVARDLVVAIQKLRS